MRFILCTVVMAASASAAADGPVLYFKTTDYATFMCDTPKVAADVNLVSHGFPVTTDPTYDNQWMQKQVTDKKCKQLAPNAKFLAAPAAPIYVGDYGVQWVTGVIAPGSPEKGPIGYVPIDYAQFIPIPRL